MYINYIILNNLFEYINYCSLIGWNSYQSDVLMIMSSLCNQSMGYGIRVRNTNEFKQKNKSLLSELALELVNDTRGLIKIVHQDSATKHLTVPRV